MKTLCILTFILFYGHNYAQEQSINYKKSSIGLMLYTNYSYRAVQSSIEDNLLKEIRDNTEKAHLGKAISFNYGRKLSTKFKLDVALKYAFKSYQTKYETLNWVTGDSGFPNKSKTIFQFTFVDIPVRLKYYFFNKKVKLYATAGASINFFFEKKQSVISMYSNGNKSIESSTGYTGTNFLSYTVIEGVGLQYPLSKRINLNLELLGNQGITTLIRDKILKEYLYDYGVSVGIYYSFIRK